MIIYSDKRSLRQRLNDILTVEETHLKSFDECIEDRSIRLTSGEQLPELFKGGMWGNHINHKTITEKTGKDKGHISRLLNTENMQLSSFLSLCEALKLEVYVKGRMYQEEE